MLTMKWTVTGSTCSIMCEQKLLNGPIARDEVDTFALDPAQLQQKKTREMVNGKSGRSEFKRRKEKQLI